MYCVNRKESAVVNMSVKKYNCLIITSVRNGNRIWLKMSITWSWQQGWLSEKRRQLHTKNPDILKQKCNALYSCYIASLTRQVQCYHDKGVDMPWIDPADGGVKARMLILLQSPARSDLMPVFVSLDNPCPSQQNLHRFLKQTRIKRKDIILWNTMPWLTT